MRDGWWSKYERDLILEKFILAGLVFSYIYIQRERKREEYIYLCIYLRKITVTDMKNALYELLVDWIWLRKKSLSKDRKTQNNTRGLQDNYRRCNLSVTVISGEEREKGK